MKLSGRLCASVVAVAAFALAATDVSAEQARDQQTHSTPSKLKKPNGASTELQDEIEQTKKAAVQKEQYKQLESQMQKQHTQLNKQMTTKSKNDKPPEKNMIGRDLSPSWNPSGAHNSAATRGSKNGKRPANNVVTGEPVELNDSVAENRVATRGSKNKKDK